MRLVILETPYAGDVETNLKFARECVRDCLMRDEAPIASHLLYTQPGILNDNIQNERKLGINAGHAWIEVADAMVVYEDFGISAGMYQGIAKARAAALFVELRRLR